MRSAPSVTTGPTSHPSGRTKRTVTLKGKPTVVNTRVVFTSVGTNTQGQKINNVLVFEKG